jgi:hypothetical protein
MKTSLERLTGYGRCNTVSLTELCKPPEAMEPDLLSAEDVRAALAPLTLKQLEWLEVLSKVPASTIYKIKLGTTANPGMETVRQFWPHIDAAQAELRDPPAKP